MAFSARRGSEVWLLERAVVRGWERALPPFVLAPQSTTWKLAFGKRIGGSDSQIRLRLPKRLLAAVSLRATARRLERRKKNKMTLLRSFTAYIEC